jgi:hypothetical protein
MAARSIWLQLQLRANSVPMRDAYLALGPPMLFCGANDHEYSPYMANKVITGMLASMFALALAVIIAVAKERRN